MYPQHSKVLFLTTQDPSTIIAEWPFYQNWTLPQALTAQGVSVSKLCWRNPTITVQKLTTFDVISLLWCKNYHVYADEFVAFLKDVLIPATKLSPSLQVVNNANIILWNVDKETYLQDLSSHGYLIPDTKFVPSTHIDSLAYLTNAIATFASTLSSATPIILKPSISASSKMTYLISNPYEFSASDTAFLETIIASGVSGSLLIQAYEPTITKGEYSMVFIDNIHTHTMVKTPAAGEFRCQAKFGGGVKELPIHLVPKSAIVTAEKVIAHLQRKFPSGDGNRKGGAVYARVDGVVREDGQFVLMEIEAIEPHLWLETVDAPGCRELLYAALLGEPGPVTVSEPPVQVQKKGSVLVSVDGASDLLA